MLAQRHLTRHAAQPRLTTVRPRASRRLQQCVCHVQEAPAMTHTFQETQRTLSISELGDEDHIRSLLSGKVGALRFPGFETPEESAGIVRALMPLGVDSYQLGNSSLMLETICSTGKSFQSCCKSEEHLAEYHEQAKDFTRFMVQLYGREGLTPPVDNFIAQLCMARKGGAAIMSLQHKQLYAGIARVFRQMGAILPHNDDLNRELRGAGLLNRVEELVALDFQGQMGFDLCHQVPDVGGELALWGILMPDVEYAARVKAGGTYGIPFEALPQPAVMVKPAAGELVLFDSRRMHAVMGVPEDQRPRIATSCFVACCGAEKPLLVWS